MTEEKFLAEMAKQCRSCPECWDVPCGGCVAGGVCDRICNCEPDDDVRGSLDDMETEP